MGAPLESSRVKSGAVLRDSVGAAEEETFAGDIVNTINSAVVNAIPADIGRNIFRLPPHSAII
jgi:hypothetical protein